MLSEKFLFVLFAVTLKGCQSEIADPDQRVGSRLLGTLNRYYLSSWDLMVNGTEYLNLANTEEAVNQLDFMDGYQSVAIVIHGRESSAFSQFGQTLRSSFIMSDRNVIVILVDWAMIAMDYATAVNAAPFVADDIISLIVKLEASSKINRNLVHIVGFDIGAHVAGIVSRDSRARVQRVTGLSPAGQNWDSFSRRLRATDANYVEIVHTDYTGTRALGISETIGTVDIYANTGTSQPRCSNNQCNHDRAWQLFAASLDMGGHLVGLKCETLTDMTRNRCTGAPAVSLGTNDLFKLGLVLDKLNNEEFKICWSINFTGRYNPNLAYEELVFPFNNNRDSMPKTGIYRVNTGRVYPYNS